MFEFVFENILIIFYATFIANNRLELNSNHMKNVPQSHLWILLRYIYFMYFLQLKTYIYIGIFVCIVRYLFEFFLIVLDAFLEYPRHISHCVFLRSCTFYILSHYQVSPCRYIYLTIQLWIYYSKNTCHKFIPLYSLLFLNEYTPGIFQNEFAFREFNGCSCYKSNFLFSFFRWKKRINCIGFKGGFDYT